MKSVYAIIAIVLAYFAIGSVVVGIQISMMDDLHDGDLVALLITIWPFVLMNILLRVFWDLAKEISGKDGK